MHHATSIYQPPKYNGIPTVQKQSIPATAEPCCPSEGALALERRQTQPGKQGFLQRTTDAKNNEHETKTCRYKTKISQGDPRGHNQMYFHI